MLEYIDDNYGKYISHRIEGQSTDEIKKDKDYLSLLPIENRLVVDFDNAEVQYIAYNLSNVQIDSINSLGGETFVNLLSSKDHFDELPTLNEKFAFGKCKQFFLSSIMFKS